ncbi:hypothetical protein GF377_02660 [candidate division GN15 bacterium]|nr:hypothetical protein [candidate division GN15 bacterium]
MAPPSSTSKNPASLAKSGVAALKKRVFSSPQPCHISLQLLSNSGQVTLADFSYEIQVSGSRTEKGKTDDEGCLTIDRVPPGDYPLRVAFGEKTVLVPAVPVDVTHMPIRVPGVLMCGHDGMGFDAEDNGMDSTSDPDADVEADEVPVGKATVNVNNAG